MEAKLIDTIKGIVSANVKFFAGVCRDNDGVPIPFFLSDISVSGDRISFSLPRVHPAWNFIKENPEISLCLVDIESVWKWQDPKGLQVKGIADILSDKVQLEIYEIYDVIPKAGLDLTIPIFRKKLMWMKKNFSAKYSFDKGVKNVQVNIQKEVRDFRDKVHSSGFPAFVGTIDPLNGIPNVGLRWIVEMDSKSWAFGDGARHKTQINAERPCPVSIAFFDPIRQEGYTAFGWVEPSYDPAMKNKIEEFWKTKGINVPAIKVNLFHPEEIYKFSRITWQKIYEGRPRSNWLKKG